MTADRSNHPAALAPNKYSQAEETNEKVYAKGGGLPNDDFFFYSNHYPKYSLML